MNLCQLEFRAFLMGILPQEIHRELCYLAYLLLTHLSLGKGQQQRNWISAIRTVLRLVISRLYKEENNEYKIMIAHFTTPCIRDELIERMADLFYL